jgi:putative ubiquitin-RnfH superfamily antitoxin RatB of RatAB toxin-antitoxin module
MPRVSIAIALPDRQEVFELDLAAGSTVADAIAAADLATRFPGLDSTSLKAGIWSHLVARETLLRDGDRVELYRDLKADPKDLRRARARLKPSTRSRNEP